MIKRMAEENPEGVVAKAYKFAEKKHAKQKRRTGEPYFIHCLATATQLAKWGMDEETIAAGLLHDVLEDTETTKEEMEKEFGEKITELVLGVSKIGRVKYRGEEAQAELLRKMMLSLTSDVRTVLVKLADRLHNMKTLGALPAQKQKRIALETAEIYAPLAYRLGMRELSGELEDLAFPYIDPRNYEMILELVKKYYGRREKYLEKVKPIIEDGLKNGGIGEFEISFRAKRYYSLYKKLKRNEMNIENIYDLIAFRIIVPTVEKCYAALGIIHSLWPPVPGRIKDYIATPKPNGYKSLHTTVFCLDGIITEFQVRTREMHEEAEEGIAAHWIYKREGKISGEKFKNLENLSRETEWVKNMQKWKENFKDASGFINAIKSDFFKERIYAITPKGEVIDLPSQATPIDFAYKVHSLLGHETTGAKVNGKIVPLNTELNSGDIVEILRQKGKKPSEDWIGFVKTQSAKDHIKYMLNKKKGKKNF